MLSSSIVKSVHGRQYREYRGSAANLYTTHCCLPRDYWGHLPSPTFPLSDKWWPPSKNLVWSLHPAGRSDFRSKSGVERDVLRSSARSYIVLTLPPFSGRNSERLQGGLGLALIWPIQPQINAFYQFEFVNKFKLERQNPRSDTSILSFSAVLNSTSQPTCLFTRLESLAWSQQGF